VSELETLLGDGAPDSPTGETGTRRKLIEGFKDEAKRFRAGFSDGGDASGANAAMGGGGAGPGGSSASSALASDGRRVGDASTAAAAVPDVTEATSAEELLETQRRQIEAQDEAMDKLDGLVGKLKSTSFKIADEVELQAKMVDDLTEDFAHTQARLKKLRKQGFKLAGEGKNDAERERMEHEETMAAKKKSYEDNYEKDKVKEDESASGCVIA
jgi:hypothetical protein|tara:strand:+ start:845 stop:1486 length:642 start_codon:yes stop_codon:yes gene_type:complete